MKFSIISAVACTLLAATVGTVTASPIVERDISSFFQTFQSSTPEEQTQMIKSIDLNVITPAVCEQLAGIPAVAKKLITPAVVKNFVKKMQKQK
ncbi:hypothetical protein FB45DRAFT_1034722 [Roridomyces roridus]|nr:hypothetical protein FB45DRAFT_1034722 [Roridomyces roridus]